MLIKMIAFLSFLLFYSPNNFALKGHAQVCKIKGSNTESSCFATRVNNNYLITSNHCTNGKGGALNFIECPGGGVPRTYQRFEHQNTNYESNNLNYWVSGDYSLIKVHKALPPLPEPDPFIRMPKSIDEVLEFFEKTSPSKSSGKVKINTTDPSLTGKEMSFKTKSSLKLKKGNKCIFTGGLKQGLITVEDIELSHWIDQSEEKPTRAGYLYSRGFYDQFTKNGEVKKGSSGSSFCCYKGKDCVLIALTSTNILWTFVGEEMINYFNTHTQKKVEENLKAYQCGIFSSKVKALNALPKAKCKQEMVKKCGRNFVSFCLVSQDDPSPKTSSENCLKLHGKKPIEQRMRRCNFSSSSEAGTDQKADSK